MRPALIGFISFCISVFLALLGMGLPMMGVGGFWLGLILSALASLFFTGAVIGGVLWIWPSVEDYVSRMGSWIRVYWVTVGGSIVFGLLLGGIDWWLSNLPYHALGIGLAAFVLALVASIVWEVRLTRRLAADRNALLENLLAGMRPTGTRARGTLTVEYADVSAAIERLREDNEQLRAERDAHRRQRCLDVSNDLRYFLEGKEQQDPEETMRQYEEHLKDRVDHLRAELKNFGWWNPRESEKEKLEKPAHPDDLRSLDGYVRNIGLGLL